jgi:signal transduction histidine kinase
MTPACQQVTTSAPLVAGRRQAPTASQETNSGPLAAVGAVVDEMRARGLAVDLDVEGCAAAPGSPEPGLVPAPVAAALAHATREALANVAEHAGTGQAWVTVSMTAPGGPGTAARIRVTVRDAGAGFDPGRVGRARLGIRRSITERVEDRGGSASVRSAPGAGTTVSLCWPVDDAGVAAAGVRAAGAAGRGEPGQW